MKATAILIAAVIGFLTERRTLCQSMNGDVFEDLLFRQDFILSFALTERVVVIEIVCKLRCCCELHLFVT